VAFGHFLAISEKILLGKKRPIAPTTWPQGVSLHTKLSYLTRVKKATKMKVPSGKNDRRPPPAGGKSSYGTLIHLFPPVIHLYPPVSTCFHLFPPVSTCFHPVPAW
jgi:hypothetical protein